MTADRSNIRHRLLARGLRLRAHSRMAVAKGLGGSVHVAVADIEHGESWAGRRHAGPGSHEGPSCLRMDACDRWLSACFPCFHSCSHQDHT